MSVLIESIADLEGLNLEDEDDLYAIAHALGDYPIHGMVGLRSMLEEALLPQSSYPGFTWWALCEEGPETSKGAYCIGEHPDDAPGWWSGEAVAYVMTSEGDLLFFWPDEVPR